MCQQNILMNIRDQTNINYDRTMMRNRLNKCIDLRNQYFHHRSENIDNVFLKESWSIIKSVNKEILYGRKIN